MIRKILLLLVISTTAYAAGDGHGEPKDVLWPLFNVLLLGAFLVYKLKTPLNNYFSNASKSISDSLDRANLKSKEAQVMMETQERKNNNLKNEINEIHNKANLDAVNFEKSYAAEISAKIEKMKLDAVAKVDAERKSIINELNAQILDKVIEKTKQTIKSNSEYQSKANQKMIEGIR